MADLFAWIADHLATVGVDGGKLALIIVIILVSAFMRGLTGFGFAIAAVPLMSVFIDPRLAIGVSIVLPLPFGLADLAKAWPESHRPAMPRLIVGAIIGTPVGMYLLRFIPPEAQRVIIAAVATWALAAVFLFKKAQDAGPLGRSAVAGVGSGLMNGLAGMPGPPVVAYLLTQPIPPAVSRSSMIVFFLATGLIGTASGIATGVVTAGSAIISAICLAPFCLGNWAGRKLFYVGDPKLYRQGGLALLVVGAASAAWRGLAGLL